MARTRNSIACTPTLGDATVPLDSSSNGTETREVPVLEEFNRSLPPPIDIGVERVSASAALFLIGRLANEFRFLLEMILTNALEGASEQARNTLFNLERLLLLTEFSVEQQNLWAGKISQLRQAFDNRIDDIDFIEEINSLREEAFVNAERGADSVGRCLQYKMGNQLKFVFEDVMEFLRVQSRTEYMYIRLGVLTDCLLRPERSWQYLTPSPRPPTYLADPADEAPSAFSLVQPSQISERQIPSFPYGFYSNQITDGILLSQVDLVRVQIRSIPNLIDSCAEVHVSDWQSANRFVTQLTENVLAPLRPICVEEPQITNPVKVYGNFGLELDTVQSRFRRNCGEWIPLRHQLFEIFSLLDDEGIQIRKSEVRALFEANSENLGRMYTATCNLNTTLNRVGLKLNGRTRQNGAFYLIEECRT